MLPPPHCSSATPVHTAAPEYIDLITPPHSGVKMECRSPLADDSQTSEVLPIFGRRSPVFMDEDATRWPETQRPETPAETLGQDLSSSCQDASFDADLHEQVRHGSSFKARFTGILRVREVRMRPCVSRFEWQAHKAVYGQTRLRAHRSRRSRRGARIRNLHMHDCT